MKFYVEKDVFHVKPNIKSYSWDHMRVLSMNIETFHCKPDYCIYKTISEAEIWYVSCKKNFVIRMLDILTRKSINKG